MREVEAPDQAIDVDLHECSICGEGIRFIIESYEDEYAAETERCVWRPAFTDGTVEICEDCDNYDPSPDVTSIDGGGPSIGELKLQDWEYRQEIGH